MEPTNTILEKHLPWPKPSPSMEFRVRLLHADGQQRVVRVEAFEAGHPLGSALGEAENAEEAEDRALDRLRRRLRGTGRPLPAPQRSGLDADPAGSLAPPSATGRLSDESGERREAEGPRDPGEAEGLEGGEGTLNLPPSVNEQPREPDPDPEDWSTDLSFVDSLLRQLGWGREQERTFLQRLFGHPSRSRLTRYAELLHLRRALEALPAGSQPETAPLPLLRSDLLAQCDTLLDRLGWSTEQARQSLESQFQATSRQRLSDSQLLAFNLMLETELLNRSAAGEKPAAARVQ